MVHAKTVGDVMTCKVAVVREEDNLLSLLDGMEQLRFHHLPVVDGERVVGMLSQRDLLAMAAPRRSEGRNELERRLEATFVAQVMRRDVQTVSPETALGAAARRLVEARIGALPVVDAAGCLKGVVTSTDLLRAAAQSFDAEAR